MTYTLRACVYKTRPSNDAMMAMIRTTDGTMSPNRGPLERALLARLSTVRPEASAR